MYLKSLYILSLLLTFYEFLPCFKQIFYRNDSIVRMNKFNITHTNNVTPPPTVLPVLEKIKNVYMLWNGYHLLIPKVQRYSLGNRIDEIFIEIIEMVAEAAFLVKSEKIPYIKVAIRKLDTLKILLMILWETKGLEEKKYITISTILYKIGRNLEGWLGQLNREFGK